MHYLSLKKKNKKRQFYIRDVQPTRTWPAATRSYCSGSRTQVPSSKTQRRQVNFKSPPSKPVKLNPPEDIKYLRILKLFDELFSLIWQILATKTIRSGIDTLDSAILDTIWGEIISFDEIFARSG